MRLESEKFARKKWKKRSKKVFDKLVESCGGQKDGVIFFLSKPVRADYLRQAISELTRDAPHGKVMFYRSLPVNVEAWLRSLCEYSVATYVPAWWRLGQSAKMRHVTKRTTFARLGIFNQVVEAEGPLLNFATHLSHGGIETMRVTRETHEAVANKLLESEKSPVTAFRSEEDYFNLGAKRREAVVVAHLRPTQSVQYEEIVGLLSRGGFVACTGTHRRLLFGTFTDESGKIVKRLSDEIVPYYLVDHVERCADSPLWSMELGTPSFLSNDPLEGADCVLRLSDGLRLRTVVSACEEPCASKSDKTLEALAKCVASVLRRHLTEKQNEALSRTASLTRGGSDIVARLCATVKRGQHETSDSDGERTTALKEWVGQNFVKSAELVPKKCRNAWVTSEGQEVEKTDVVVRKTLRDRKRWPSDFTRCQACPELHVDERKREEQECGSAFCKSKFLYSDSCTHIFFRGIKRKKTEIDKNAPLFTDAALRELQRCTDFVM